MDYTSAKTSRQQQQQHELIQSSERSERYDVDGNDDFDVNDLLPARSSASSIPSSKAASPLLRPTVTA